MHVRAQTRIELRIAREPNHVRVDATLRDDLGEPLADRRLEVRILDPSSQSQERAAQDTSAAGEVSVTFEIPPGVYELRARFDGDEGYEQREVAQMLDLERAHVRLSVSVGEGGRLDLDREEHTIEVHALSEEGGSALHVEIENELGRQLADTTTDGSGRATFTIASETLGPPAAGRLIVRTGGDARRSAAQTEVPIVRYRPTQISLRASTDRAGEGEAEIRLSGEIFDTSGPLPRKAVGLFAGEEHLATVLSDDRGRFVRTVDPSGEGRIAIVARYASDAPWRTDAVSSPVHIDIEERGSTPWPFFLVPMIFCAALIAFLSRRSRETRGAALEPAQRISAPGIAPARAAGLAQRRDVAGMVLEAEEGLPLSDAIVLLVSAEGERIELSTDDEGRFSIESLATDLWQLSATAPGHERSEAALRLPHRGQWSAVTIRLRSLRQVALTHYRPVAQALAPARKWWAFWTARELLEQVPPVARPELETLTDALEAAAYAEPDPSEGEVAEIGRRSEDLAPKLGKS